MIDALSAKTKFPYYMNVKDGEPRSLKQNRLYHKWMQELAEQDQTPDYDAEWFTSFCKLHFGVGILKAEDIEYAAFYDKFVRPRPYEEKFEMMREPYGFPVTSMMSMKQMTAYMDKIQQHAAQQGFILTQPDF